MWNSDNHLLISSRETTTWAQNENVQPRVFLVFILMYSSLIV